MLEQQGRFPKFKVNRKLENYEYKYQLKQGTLAEDRARYIHLKREYAECMTTIKINSSYLEVVDRLYVRRGTYTFGGSIFLWIALFVVYLTIVSTPYVSINMIIYACMVAVMFSSTAIPAYFLLKTEMFNLTHNPIRFDRRNRMVYAFLYNKEVVAVPWDDVFFTFEGNNDSSNVEFDIRGHILADDRVTIKGIFALGHLADNTSELDMYWDFIRIYMDSGPETLVDTFRFCLPIADRREPLTWGINNYRRQFAQLFYLIFPIAMYVVACRFVALRTCRIPVWPDWIEEKCRIEPDDPYVRDASTNPPVYPFTNLFAQHLTSVPYMGRPYLADIICASVLGSIATYYFVLLIFKIKMAL